MINAELQLPTISPVVARHARLPVNFKTVCERRHLVVIDDRAEFAQTSNLVFPGYHLPVEVMDRELAESERVEVIVKVAKDSEDDEHLNNEMMVLIHLMSIEGSWSLVPKGEPLQWSFNPAQPTPPHRISLSASLEEIFSDSRFGRIPELPDRIRGMSLLGRRPTDLPTGISPLFDHLGQSDLVIYFNRQPGFPYLVEHGLVNLTYVDLESASRGRGLIPACKQSTFCVMFREPGKNFSEYRVGEDQVPEQKQFERIVRLMLIPLAEKLAILHGKGIVHRDVKPNQVLWDEVSGQVTLLDFGRAAYLGSPTHILPGAFGYYPPELALEKPEVVDVRTDIYGFGVTCLDMLSGKNGLWYKNMDDGQRSADPFVDPEETTMCYYTKVAALRNCSYDELLAQSRLPDWLKSTPLGKYLHVLFHPDKEKRPPSMMDVIRTFRLLT